jgi:hypothetical protein
VVTEDLRAWTMRGRFREFVQDGPYVDYMNEKELFRYNAYVGVSRVGVIETEEVTGSWHRGKLGIAAELLPTKAWSCMQGGGGDKAISHRVTEKFARTRAVKVLAFQGSDGYPTIVPAFSLVPAGSDSMLFGMKRSAGAMRELQPGARVAASVITADPIAYQIKGTYEGHGLTPLGRMGRICVDEVYSASPPLAGDRIEMTSATEPRRSLI